MPHEDILTMSNTLSLATGAMGSEKTVTSTVTTDHSYANDLTQDGLYPKYFKMTVYCSMSRMIYFFNKRCNFKYLPYLGLYDKAP